MIRWWRSWPRRPACPVIGYGTGAGCEWRLTDLRAHGLATEFAVYHHDRLLGRCRLPMPGLHNCLNALAVIALLSRLGFAFEAIAGGWPPLKGSSGGSRFAAWFVELPWSMISPIIRPPFVNPECLAAGLAGQPAAGGV